MANSRGSSHLFGTFGGVFTPCTLTILGVILFLRFGEVVGQAGVIHALIIVLAAKTITSLTAFSLSAIATNTPVRGGGAYFMISRTLGLAPGGAIGLVLFIAQALSVALYVIGFTEAWLAILPDTPGGFTVIASVVNLLVFLCVWIGAGWTIKLQYGILLLLALSLISFAVGAFPTWTSTQLQSNLSSAYTGNHSIFTAFALFFPAVTGIMAGANMSGELADPARAIPRGTLWSIAVTGLIYMAMVVVLGGLAAPDVLISDRMIIHRSSAIPVLVTAGIFSATLSSALGSMMGAPRILQALAKDRVFAPLRLFAKGSGKHQEPRRAVLATAVIAQSALLAGGLNSIAPILTMFFLITYGMINWSCFAELHSRNPSFRPQFRIAHESIPLLGAAACLAVMFLLNFLWAVAALLVIGLLYFWLQRQDLETRWGDVNSGVAFERAKRTLLFLSQEQYHPKNWRPALLVFTGNPLHRLHLAQLGVWLTDKGLLTLAQIVVDDKGGKVNQQPRAERELHRFILDHRLPAFPAVVSSSSFPEGARHLTECHGLGNLRPNTVMLGWSNETGHEADFGQVLRTFAQLKRSILIVHGSDALGVASPPNSTVDVWWRGQNHGPLMLLLAHLLCQNQEWGDCTIRLIRCTANHQDVPAVRKNLEALIQEARISAEPHVVVTANFQQALKKESGNAAMVFLGFRIPDPGKEVSFMQSLQTILNDMPTAILVNSEGSARLEA